MKGMTRLGRTAISALVGVMTMVSAAPVAAQSAGVPIDREAARIDARELRSDRTNEARRVLADYARCVVARYGGRGDLLECFIEAPPGTRVAHRAGERLAGSACLANHELSFDPELFRGVIYEVLYRRDFAASPVPDLTIVPVSTDSQIGAHSESPRQLMLLRQYAGCVVRAAPDRARSLVLSGTTEADEEMAFTALRDPLSACLADGQLRFSRSMLRGLLAESLYLLSKVAISRAPVQSAAN